MSNFHYFYSVINEVFFLFYFCSSLFEGPTKLYSETSALSLRHADALAFYLPLKQSRFNHTTSKKSKKKKNPTKKTTNMNTFCEKYTFFPLFSWTTVKLVGRCEKVISTAKKP